MHAGVAAANTMFLLDAGFHLHEAFAAESTRVDLYFEHLNGQIGKPLEGYPEQVP